MRIWKRNAVMAAIVLFVCVAVYLNWSYSQTDTVSSTWTDPALELEADTETGKTLGQAELVSESAPSNGDFTVPPSDYFSTARIHREEARAEALTILQDTVDDPDADSAAVNAASDSITAMAGAAMEESQIESLVTAKGYTDCVAFVGDNSVSVVVSTASGELQAADVARVTDIVVGETGCSADAVKVIPAQSATENDLNTNG